MGWLEQRLFPWLLVGVFVAGIVLVLNLVPGGPNVLRLILLGRYGLMAGLLLVGFVPLALLGAPNLLGSLFVFRKASQLFNVCWIAVLVAAMSVVTTRVVEVNATCRYGTEALDAPAGVWGIYRVLIILFLSLPTAYAGLVCSRTARLPQTEWRWGRWIGAAVGGLVLGLALVALAPAVQQFFLAQTVQIPGLFPFQDPLNHLGEQLGGPKISTFYGLGDWLGWLASRLGEDGLAELGKDGTYRLAPGHAQVLAGMAAVFLFYLGSYAWGDMLGGMPNRNSSLPALFFLLLLLLLVGYVLQGLAFVLDLYRVPISLVGVLLSFVLYQVTGTDHFFRLDPRADRKKPAGPPTSVTAAETPTLAQVVPNWNLPPASRGPDGAAGKKTLVVVTASGGGIQATAWTARVLVGLQERYGADLTRSIGLISAVSGGSVGTMFYLDQWQAGAASPLQPQALAFGPNGLPAPGSVCERAMESGLEATGWGIVFPDLLRVVFPPFVSRTDDRGAWIEDAWRSRLRVPDARLTDWSAPTGQGAMPVTVFNATTVETGQRLLASPVLLPTTGRQMLELYPGTRPRVATAARLSATFPFVSPICRPLRTKTSEWPEKDAYHFADGGYVDNEGMVTVIECLRALLNPGYLPAEQRRRAFDQILLVRLMPFPAAAHSAPAATGKGWIYSTLGPIEALQNVRTASQVERNNTAVSLLIQDAAQQKVHVEAARFTFESPTGAQPPLSWLLTEPQKAAINVGWDLVLKGTPDNPLAVVDRFFPRRT
jgi:hypothetical protein